MQAGGGKCAGEAKAKDSSLRLRGDACLDKSYHFPVMTLLLAGHWPQNFILLAHSGGGSVIEKLLEVPSD